MSKVYYRKRGLLHKSISLPQNGVPFPQTGRDWLCRLGRHSEVHYSGETLCTVACKICGKLLWQHEKED